MDQYVRKYVRSCDICQRMKNSQEKSTGLLQPLPIPTQIWESVSLDFITHLPKTDREKDAILVVVDRLSKQAHFIATTKTVTAEETARLFLETIFKLHGMPKTLVSDRDPRFTSDFWRSLMRLLGTELLMSSSYHPETDGQTERTNRTLQQMLRTTSTNLLTDWDLELPLMEFAYNNLESASTKQSPFFTVYGIHPRTPLNLSSISAMPANHAVDEILTRTGTSVKIAQDNLILAQEYQEKYANNKRKDQLYSIEDKVLLSTTNIRPKNTPIDLKRSLEQQYIGPFEISERISDVAYRLRLPKSMGRLHPIFHVSQLKLYMCQALEA